MREKEIDGTLCWWDYSSWRYFQNQDEFIRIINPVLWNGVFFAVEDFLVHYESLFLKTNQNSIFIFGRHYHYYRVFSFGLVPNGDRMDYLNEKQFQAEIDFFKDFLVLRTTCHIDGKIYDKAHNDYFYNIMHLFNLYNGLE